MLITSTQPCTTRYAFTDPILDEQQTEPGQLKIFSV
jgi:hypothetical protein